MAGIVDESVFLELGRGMGSPSLLLRIPLQRTAQMGTASGETVRRFFPGFPLQVDPQRGAYREGKTASGGFLPGDDIGQQLRRHLMEVVMPHLLNPEATVKLFGVMALCGRWGRRPDLMPCAAQRWVILALGIVCFGKLLQLIPSPALIVPSGVRRRPESGGRRTPGQAVFPVRPDTSRSAGAFSSAST